MVQAGQIGDRTARRFRFPSRSSREMAFHGAALDIAAAVSAFSPSSPCLDVSKPTMQNFRSIAWLIAAWLAFLGLYAVVSHHLGPSRALSSFGDIVQCFVPLLANAGLLLNAGTPHWRRNVFWMLLAMGCTLWMIGQFEWTYYEVYLHKALPDPYPGDILFFLRGIPVMAALALRPHLRRSELRMGFGYLDFAVLLTWWTYLYVFTVMPWIYASPSTAQYNFAFNVVEGIQNLVIVVSLGVLWLRSSGAWRMVYTNLFIATALYALSALAID